MRKKIFDLVEISDEKNRARDFYDFLLMATIVISLVPLAFKETNQIFKWIEYVSTWIFIIDYILRLITADLKLNKSVASFFIYPFTPMAIVDLLSILPTLTMLNSSLRLLKMFRLFHTMKVLRALKFLRYSKSFELISNVFSKEKHVLSAVATTAVAYILISALAIYSVEPDSFNTFFDAIYWATISLTTVGYGDIYPVSTVGRIVAMISSIFGIAIIALPSGVITVGYLEEISKNKDE